MRCTRYTTLRPTLKAIATSSRALLRVVSLASLNRPQYDPVLGVLLGVLNLLIKGLKGHNGVFKVLIRVIKVL
jgi:hypothetical protein